MVRTPLTEAERDRGRALGRTLRSARGGRSAASVALAAGVPVDTLRKIERGVIPTPTFFTVAALARVLDLNLAELATVGPAPEPTAERMVEPTAGPAARALRIA
jgi:hypothetical protein